MNSGDSLGVFLPELAAGEQPADAAQERPAITRLKEGETIRVSVGPAGVESNHDSGISEVSRNGRFIAFWSIATNLVKGGTSGPGGIFIHDRRKGVNELVVDGTPFLVTHSMSANGHFVAFSNDREDLVAGDNNGETDVFVFDRKSKTTKLLSVGADGTQGDQGSYEPNLSANGQWVAFESESTTLVDGTSDVYSDVFVRHRLKRHAIEKVSVAPGGAPSDGDSAYPFLSRTGRYVAFDSWAPNLVEGDTNGFPDVFVHDRVTGITERVSVSSDGVEGNGQSQTGAISANGRYVVINSGASNLAPDDKDRWYDVFLHDRMTGFTELISVNSRGVGASRKSLGRWVSDDGRYVAFSSGASNLVPGDTNRHWDVFLRDRLTSKTRRVSLGTGGVQGNHLSSNSWGSRGAKYLVFTSAASNLVDGDTNGESAGVSGSDVFLRRLTRFERNAN